MKCMTDILALAFTECREAVEREDCNTRCRQCGILTDAVKDISKIMKDAIDQVE